MSNIIDDKGRNDYNHIINYLINNIDKKQEDHISSENDKPVFLYEFFIFDLVIPKEILNNIIQPLLCFRLFDFPTQTLEGKIDKDKECINFNQGKCCFFEMEINYLKEYLVSEPLYVMFVDMNGGDMKIIGSSKVNISIFSYDNFLNFSGNIPKSRRNILKLFDNTLTNVAEFDISLIIRREYFKYEDIHRKYHKYETDIHISNPQTYEHPISFEKESNEIKKSNVYKKDSCINTDIQTPQIKYISPNQELLNQNTKNYTKNLKELLEGNIENAPPLYFHNKRQIQNREILVKVVNESNKEQNKENEENLLKQVNYLKKEKKLEKKNIIKPTEDIKINYDKKMKEVDRYNISIGKSEKSDYSQKSDKKQYSRNDNKDFFEEDINNEEDNEYFKLYTKLNLINDKIKKKDDKEIVNSKIHETQDHYKNTIKHQKTIKQNNNQIDDIVKHDIKTDEFKKNYLKVSESDKFTIINSIKESVSIKESIYEIKTSAVINIINMKENNSEVVIKESLDVEDISENKTIEEESFLKNKSICQDEDEIYKFD